MLNKWIAKYDEAWDIRYVFTCENCNAECCRLPYIEGIVPEENGFCKYLKNNRCLIYEDRPKECIFFPFYWNVKNKCVYVYAALNHCPGTPKLIHYTEANKEHLDNFLNQLNVILDDLKNKGLL